MEKPKNADKTRAKKRTPAKAGSSRRTQAVSANDNQNQIDHDSQTTPGETPKRKPVTNTDDQKKSSNTGNDYNDEEDNNPENSGGTDDDYEGPNDPSKRGDDPDKTRREQPKMM
jgi:hypothetical protein